MSESSSSSSSSGEPKSANRIALEAITAYIQGRATSQQKRIQVGDKSIEYSTFDELLKLKNYFEGEVRKEEGKTKYLRHEKIFWRGW